MSDAGKVRHVCLESKNKSKVDSYKNSSYLNFTLESSGVARILLEGTRARGARVPKFVMTKSSRSESHLALGLHNLRIFANSRGHVRQCPMPDDATVREFTIKPNCSD